jgi:hypothetical protein
MDYSSQFFFFFFKKKQAILVVDNFHDFSVNIGKNNPKSKGEKKERKNKVN